MNTEEKNEIIETPSSAFSDLSDDLKQEIEELAEEWKQKKTSGAKKDFTDYVKTRYADNHRAYEYFACLKTCRKDQPMKSTQKAKHPEAIAKEEFAELLRYFIKKYFKHNCCIDQNSKIFLLDAVDVPKGLKETTITINEKEVKAYKFDNNSVYYIVYGINLNTGNKDFYMYDSEEYTIQRYNTTMIDKLTKEKDRYLSIVLVLSCVCFLSMLFLLIEVNKYNKIKNEN